MTVGFERRPTLQVVAWFNDLYQRNLLDLEPPYQRRAVWNQKYREFFIETVLLGYPAPAIFLHEEIRPDGSARYHVVDGKQRLTTIFDFAKDEFSVAEDSVLEAYQGQYFSQLADSVKLQFWKYPFCVEYVPTTDPGTLNNVFDRINRNVAKLTRQELRHARFDGQFAKAADDMVTLMNSKLPPRVPNIASPSRSQMKDVEFTAQLLLLSELGIRSYSQDDLDQAYSDRDADWEDEVEVRDRFSRVIDYISGIFKSSSFASSGPSSRRLGNQSDFYSLFAAVLELHQLEKLPSVTEAADNLTQFLGRIQDDVVNDKVAREYLAATRSASNDLRQRETRTRILRSVIASN